jgi:hypothetical protein
MSFRRFSMQPARSARRCVPTFECLEDRRVPSQLSVIATPHSRAENSSQNTLRQSNIQSALVEASLPTQPSGSTQRLRAAQDHDADDVNARSVLNQRFQETEEPTRGMPGELVDAAESGRQQDKNRLTLGQDKSQANILGGTNLWLCTTRDPAGGVSKVSVSDSAASYRDQCVLVFGSDSYPMAWRPDDEAACEDLISKESAVGCLAKADPVEIQAGAALAPHIDGLIQNLATTSLTEVEAGLRRFLDDLDRGGAELLAFSQLDLSLWIVVPACSTIACELVRRLVPHATLESAGHSVSGTRSSGLRFRGVTLDEGIGLPGGKLSARSVA